MKGEAAFEANALQRWNDEQDRIDDAQQRLEEETNPEPRCVCCGRGRVPLKEELCEGCWRAFDHDRALSEGRDLVRGV